MEKQTRAELIAALVTDKYSGFKDGDEAILEAASDARLEEFRSASEGRRAEASTTAKLETEHRNTSARLKVAEERLKTGEQALSEDEFLLRAPDRYKGIINAYNAEEAAVKASLVSQLKDLGANTEDELKTKSVEELKVLAQYARVSVPDYSGRGMPVERNASSKVTYTPPDPYAEGLKALRAKTVN